MWIPFFMVEIPWVCCMGFLNCVQSESRTVERKLLHFPRLWQAKFLPRLAHFRSASYPDTLAELNRRLRSEKENMTRADAIARARQHFQSGEFLAELGRRVAYPTESQNPERRDALRAYLEDELTPAFSQLDFSTRLIESPTGRNPYLLAEYRESSSAPTVLMYGHGDGVDGMAGESA